MAYAIGIILALGFALFGRLSGFDRDRSFYPFLTMVIAHYYGLFAVTANSMGALGAEAGPTVMFILAALTGYKRNLWIAVVALVGHGFFDATHHFIISNPGVPEWWPMFCGTFDSGAAACLTWLLMSRRLLARSQPRGLVAP
jgi:hypothetical protein